MHRFTARFFPEAWVRDQAVEVDPEGETQWDVTEHVLAHRDYWEDMMREESALTGSSSTVELEWSEGVMDRDDLLRSDSNAPAWIREWNGPFTIRVYRSSAQPKIEVLHSREPDSGCEITVWLDGELAGFDCEDIDPGRGYSREDWDRRTEEPQGDRSPAFTAAVRDALEQASDSKYID